MFHSLPPIYFKRYIIVVIGSYASRFLNTDDCKYRLQYCYGKVNFSIILGNGIGKSQSDGDIKNLDMKQNMKKLMLMTMNDEIRDDDEEE